MHWIALQARRGRACAEARAGVGTGVADTAGLADATTALGWWALQFTPKVALAGPAVLLEVSASERLFGGREPLVQRLLGAGRPAVGVRTAQAASSLLALALLQINPGACRDIDSLPLALLADAMTHLATLERIGCTRWGDLRALPRGGVARRFGAALLDALDRAYGLKPEPYPWLVLPEVFDLALELPAPVEAAPALLFAAHRLLAQLQVWLRARQQGVLALELAWEMDARRDTAARGQLLLRTAEPTLDMGHLQRLLAEHLARISLPAPVLALRLRSVETTALAGASASLLSDALRAGDSLVQLLERLSARLGPAQVLRALPCADHRPEHMQVWLAACPAGQAAGLCVAAPKIRPAQACGAASAALYPTWLLVPPLRLALRQDRPLYQGPLTLLVGPQRLEAGWWPASEQAAAEKRVETGAATLRDYFLARSEQAGLLWIFRERLASGVQAARQGHWYLHGLFA